MPKPSKQFDEEGKPPGVMQLESIMDPGLAYTIRELEKLTGRTYTRISYKLKELLMEGKAESKVIEHVTYWRLTSDAYLKGTVKPRKRRKKGTPGRPEKYANDPKYIRLGERPNSP